MQRATKGAGIEGRGEWGGSAQAADAFNKGGGGGGVRKEEALHTLLPWAAACALITAATVLSVAATRASSDARWLVILSN